MVALYYSYIYNIYVIKATILYYYFTVRLGHREAGGYVGGTKT